MNCNPILTETDERERLRHVQACIQAEIDRVETLVGDQSANMLELKTYLADNKADMDHVEKVSVRQSVEQMGLVGDHSASGLLRLQKLLKSSYFGRLDFRAAGGDGDAHARPIYVGIHSFYDGAAKTHLIHDWRAPISSMFYDHEIGTASYDAPSGTERGEITRKRQYRIEDGRLVFMLETSLNIHDSVLQEELSRSASEKMKNIVATIQRDQNAIIRNDRSSVLVIQGAAGSGKTSIALHRIAFLLYRFKDTVRSSDILIISPNKVFAHYISNVLPELGEENIRETTMEGLAARLLGPEYQFQTFFQQVAALFEPRSEKFRERIRFKARLDFLARLDEYIRHVKNTNFTPAPVTVGRFTIPAGLIGERHHRLGAIPFAARINDLVEVIANDLARNHHHEIKAAERTRVRKQLKGMFTNTSVDALYRGFYGWAEEPGLFKYAARGVLEYSDVYPLIYLKMQIEGAISFDEVKHLVVDEMQDYTPVQYTVLAQLFPCKKTVLGDTNQSVNPLSASTAEGIRAILPGAECVYMNKSYRSTLQISNLAQRIRRNAHLVPIERHGEEPVFVACADRAEELDRVKQAVATFLVSPNKTLGIICKTQPDAAAVFDYVGALSDRIQLIDPSSVVFSQGVTIATAHLAKGLEFDEVVLPFCDDATYQTEIDRQMLYVGCTRAMHKLTVTHTGAPARFLQEDGAPATHDS